MKRLIIIIVFAALSIGLMGQENFGGVTVTDSSSIHDKLVIEQADSTRAIIKYSLYDGDTLYFAYDSVYVTSVAGVLKLEADSISLDAPLTESSTGSIADYALLIDIAVNAQTGTSYTLALTDRGKHVTLTNAGAITLTVPPNSSVAFPYDASGDGQTQIVLSQLGAGTVTFAEGAGVTINSSGGADALTAQYTSATLIKTGINTWLLSGSIE